MNFNAIMQQAKKMQNEINRKIAEFDAKDFSYDYQNGSIIVQLKGSLAIKSIKIADALVDPEDKITLEEMVVEAVNKAIEYVNGEKDKLTSRSMPKIPGLF